MKNDQIFQINDSFHHRYSSHSREEPVLMTNPSGDIASFSANTLPKVHPGHSAVDHSVNPQADQQAGSSLTQLDSEQQIDRLKPTRSNLSRPSLDRQLIRIQRDVLKMGALVENSCLLAKAALCDRDLAAAKQIPIQDKQIDELYRQIEVDCTNLIILQAPVTQDLRLMSAFMQMVRDLERIGDYTKTISRSAIKLFPYPVHACIEDVGTMMDRCRSMVALCLRSLSELDPEAGRSIKHKDDVVDDDYERLYHQLISTPYGPNTSVEAIVLMVIVIRALERIADHATNVGKRVTYVVTGERF